MHCTTTNKYTKCCSKIELIMSTTVPQITGVSIVYSSVCSGADHRMHQSSASLAFVWFVWGIHRWPKRASNAENVSIWWRYHGSIMIPLSYRVRIHRPSMLLIQVRQLLPRGLLYLTSWFHLFWKNILSAMYVDWGPPHLNLVACCIFHLLKMQNLILEGLQ